MGKTKKVGGEKNRLSSKYMTQISMIDRTLSSATTLGQRELESNGNKGVLHIPQRSSITESSPSDHLMSCSGYLFGESYSSAEMQLVYSAASADWASIFGCEEKIL